MTGLIEGFINTVAPGQSEQAAQARRTWILVAAVIQSCSGRCYFGETLWAIHSARDKETLRLYLQNAVIEWRNKRWAERFKPKSVIRAERLLGKKREDGGDVNASR